MTTIALVRKHVEFAINNSLLTNDDRAQVFNSIAARIRVSPLEKELSKTPTNTSSPKLPAVSEINKAVLTRKHTLSFDDAETIQIVYDFIAGKIGR